MFLRHTDLLLLKCDVLLTRLLSSFVELLCLSLVFEAVERREKLQKSQKLSV